MYFYTFACIMRLFAVALFFLRASASYGQAPEVPHKLQFAGITLTVRDDARREIQKDVDALTKYPRYFNIKVERAKTYFPIIEKIFAEERLPDDFKFLALQESSLISDAVSVTNAIGFWQFKDFTALEMGLRMDNEVDERMNLISATRAAAKYIKQNNYMFNNWLYALQSYQMGAGGVQRSVGDQHNGAKHMEITSETYWYVKKYLAHKIAFENSIHGEAQVKVVPLEIQSGKSLHDIAVEVSVDEAKLVEFNKWVKTSMVPSDKTYYVLIPAGEFEDFSKYTIPTASVVKSEPKPSQPASPTIDESAQKPIHDRINDVEVITAVKGESLAALANRAKAELSSFLKYNDISVDHNPRVGAFYFLGKKKLKSSDEFYKADKAEDLWYISQLTGMQLKRLKKFNELEGDQVVSAGTLIWLNGPKPSNTIMPETEVVALIDGNAEFDWIAKPGNEAVQPIKMDKDIQQPKDLNKPFQMDSLSGRELTEIRPLQYTVNQGDTFYSVAKTNHVEIVNLLSWNNLTITDRLRPGQILKLAPAEDLIGGESEVEGPAARVHEVQSSDTLYGIARKYGITIKELMDWNGKEDLSITVGEKLRITPQ
jgi:membrane-bound lytic murein transglycosylase D